MPEPNAGPDPNAPPPVGSPELVEWVDDEDWATVVRSVPIVSVDLVVLVGDGVALARRENAPAKGEWFVPGGRVRKGERLHEAVARVAREEFGVDVEVRESLGVYEHLYSASDVPESGGKHYLANGFVVEAQGPPTVGDAQHAEVRVFESLPADLHPYVEAYCRDSALVTSRLGDP